MPADNATRILLLTLAVSNHILNVPPHDSGITFDGDEADLGGILTEIIDDVVPNYYDGDWRRFLPDYTQVAANAASDGTGDIIADIRYWIDSIYQDGKRMVA